jgi:hypothetical protein
MRGTAKTRERKRKQDKINKREKKKARLLQKREPKKITTKLQRETGPHVLRQFLILAMQEISSEIGSNPTNCCEVFIVRDAPEDRVAHRTGKTDLRSLKNGKLSQVTYLKSNMQHLTTKVFFSCKVHCGLER